ncbi:lipoprotein [Rhodoferax sp. U11-2br]|uniref:LPS translocon maturation chaperone LptM n=1 Tax=Rhodoferax sp. U11-2br TaxID=2838878 RepID=UPI0020374E91|nr:lipoprotein [Rhodoferax sp. U11-2br]
MLFQQILVRALALSATVSLLSACGQTGALYLPTPPAGTHRATLPESLVPQVFSRPAPTDTDTATAPAKASSQPVAAP